MANNTPDVLEGQILAGRFRVANIITRGANTIIADGIDLTDDAPATVKIVQPDLAATDGFMDEFRRRINIAVGLAHPNVARVLGWGALNVDGEDTVFWAVEYLGGGSLRDLLDRGRTLTPSQALVIGLEACRALDAGHAAGVVHTELTPSKLVFGNDRRVRIIDFAMAELLGAEAWEQPASVATHVARYASPEQATRGDVGARTDTYSLALVLVEAMTGDVPFAADSTVATLDARVDRLLPVSADFGSLAAILERAGRPDPHDRSTAAEFGDGLVSAAGSLPRPEPIDIITTGLSDTTDLARPAEPEAEPSDVDETVDGTDTNAVVSDAAVPDEPVAEAAGEADPRGSGDDDLDLPATQPMPAIEADTAVAADPVEANSEPETREPDTPAVAAVAAADEAPPVVSVVEVDPTDLPAATTTVPRQDAVIAFDAEPTTQFPATSDQIARDQATPDHAEHGAVHPPVAEPTAQLPPVAAAPQPPAEVYDDERRGRAGTIIAFTLVVLAGIAALSYAGWLLLRTKSFEMPDLTAQPEAVALNEISGNDWDVVRATERNDEFPEPGIVIRTEPGPGVVLDEGSVFTMIVSAGPEFRQLPDVTGQTFDEAVAMLNALDLNGVSGGAEFSEDVPAGVVLRWEVAGVATEQVPERILPGGTIVMVTSDGPAPRDVPDVTGFTVDQASGVLGDRDLTIAEGEPAFSDDVEVGLILSQDPAPGVQIERGATVTVVLSQGVDLVELPDLTGLSFEQASTALADAGFGVGSVLGSTTDGFFESLTIGGESIAPGTQFRRGTEVDLVFI